MTRGAPSYMAGTLTKGACVIMSYMGVIAPLAEDTN